MTKAQIKYLKLLGYENTKEDGAILQHKKISGTESFVWKDDRFTDVLSAFQKRYMTSLLKTIAANILK